MRCTRGPRFRTHGLSLAALLTLLPCALDAQMPASDARAEEAALARQQADLLLARGNMDLWPQAAELMANAAAARAPDDAAALNERVAAASLYYATGSLERAQSQLEAAARQAIAADHLFQAAMILLQATAVAKERGLMREAIQYARNAEWLARSPQLTPVESARIHAGIVWGPLAGQTSDT